jgi:hypothetical protein
MMRIRDILLIVVVAVICSVITTYSWYHIGYQEGYDAGMKAATDIVLTNQHREPRPHVDMTPIDTANVPTVEEFREQHGH